MLTPYFTVNQDEEYLHITIKISHGRLFASAIEMAVDSNVFMFSFSPYYLRLRFSGLLVDDERAQADLDLKNDCVKIRLPKEVKGQEFADLDLTAKLLARKEETVKSKPLIEELDVKESIENRVLEANQGTDFEKSDRIDKGDAIASEGVEHDWEVKQEITEEQLNPMYGFNNSYSQIITVSMTNHNDINEVGNPESASVNDKIIERLIKENIKFDPEYYAADYLMEKFPTPDDDKNYRGIMAWKSPSTKRFLSWYKKQRDLPELERSPLYPVTYSKEEQEKMLQLPRKSYLIDNVYKPQIYVLMLSLLFAHQFDLRENEGEHNIESAWTIGKILPQFASLDTQIVIPGSTNESILRSAIITCYRRSLCYPFHRHYELSAKAWGDVYYALRAGKRLVLKLLLELKELFRFHDTYYVYDKIYLEDLCLYILSDEMTETSIRQFAHDFKKELDSIGKTDITFEKIDDTQNGEDMVVLDLHEIEVMAQDSYQEYINGQ